MAVLARLLVILLFGIGVSYATRVLGANMAGRLPKLDFPPSVDIVEVSPEMVRNGMPMRIYGFRSHQNIEYVMDSFKSHMVRKDFTVGDVRPLGNLRTLGISDAEHFINVQGQRAEYGQGSAGFIVITPRPDKFKPRMTSPTVPVPDGVNVLSHELYNDGPRVGETYLGVSKRMASDVGASLLNAFERSGWEPASENVQLASNDIAVYRILKKEGRECRIISMDQTIKGKKMATISVNCHN